MNRRSFLLGLATVPVIGITAVAATPTVVMGIDGGGPDVRFAYVLVNKRGGMSPLAYWDEVHVFGGVRQPANSLINCNLQRPVAAFLNIKTERGNP